MKRGAELSVTLKDGDQLIVGGKVVAVIGRLDPKDHLLGSKKPPKDGPCKGCGKDRPLNRLMLCYACWVKKNLLDWAKAHGQDWLPGDPHPSWCQCALPEHKGGLRE